MAIGKTPKPLSLYLSVNSAFVSVWKLLGGLRKLHHHRAERPISGEHHLGAEEPVELVPRAHERIALLAPKIVPGAAAERDLVDEAVLVLVEVEHQSHQRLRGQAGIGD